MACALARSSETARTCRWARGRWGAAVAIGGKDLLERVTRGPSTQPVALGQGASLLFPTAARGPSHRGQATGVGHLHSRFSHIGRAHGKKSPPARGGPI